jgi:import receptor subunit TOM70
MSPSNKQTQLIVGGLAASALVAYFLWYSSSRSKGKSPSTPKGKGSSSNDFDTPQASNKGKDIHLRIEEMDKEGKRLFKKKQYLEAAQIFTDAIALIEAQDTRSSSLARQYITLVNNRSAMYEKGGVPDLALEDCATILAEDVGHIKARTRRLRVLESEEKWQEALVEMCALELKFMQDNRDKIRMGINVTPPVPHSKLEEILQKVIPIEVEKQMKINEKLAEKERPLPSKHTILQLLQSFTGYNTWMAAAAKEGSVETLTKQLETTKDPVKRVSLLYKRGRRFAYDRDFMASRRDFEEAMALGVEDLPDDEFARLLEWTGMVRHWSYNLDGATKCYERCSDLEPLNASILVKRAGVKMDSGRHEEAMALFDTALGLDPDATDALLHRANLFMLQQKPVEAKADLEHCLQLRPDNLLARLRLATVLMATNDLEGATEALDKAEQVDPNSSEVHSYRGEMHFAQGQFVEARAEFDRASECDPTSATPYVNAALALMNTPPAPGKVPDAPEAIRLLEKAIEVDPQFHAAYVHLGQLKLSMATDLVAARKVLDLYDRGLEHCRTPEETKDICVMRILTLAQIDAATMLKMETFGMQ